MLAAGKLASFLTDLLLQLARFRGLFIGGSIAAAFMLTVGRNHYLSNPAFRPEFLPQRRREDARRLGLMESKQLEQPFTGEPEQEHVDRDQNCLFINAE